VQQQRKKRPPSSKKRNDEPTAAARALRLLARRDHTRLELQRKLAPYVDDPAELQALLDDFTARDWLSESRAVDQLVHAKRGRFGSARIRQALIQKGVTEDLIAPALASLKTTEQTAAREVWSRKFKSAPVTAAERAKQIRFLQYRGFSVEVALRVVRGGEGDDGE
jgi:regulatory protein